jgi:hypothetical protein
MENLEEPIGNQTSDLQAPSTMPQPTAPPCGSVVNLLLIHKSTNARL